MATNYANASYQEIIDLHTESDTVSVIGLHSPCTDRPVKMLNGFWKQFKRVKYNGCSVSLVPAARLPADIGSVSYEAGEAPIDPRDILNPIMFHGCHGNDMGTILNSMYSSDNGSDIIARQFSDSADFNIFNKDQVGNEFMEALYYKALTDNTWKKAHPQKGFRKSGLHPMVYNVVSNTPFQNSLQPSGNTIGPTIRSEENANFGMTGELGLGSSGGAIYVKSTGGIPKSSTDGEVVYDEVPVSVSGIGFNATKLVPLGWQETRSRILKVSATSGNLTGNEEHDSEENAKMFSLAENDALIGKHFMGMILLPPAYKAEQFFRLIINHNFSFAGFRGASMQNSTPEEVNDFGQYQNFN